MKQVILILIVLIAFKVTSQEKYKIEVTYKENRDFDIEINKICQLQINNTQSYYIEKEVKENFEKTKSKIHNYGGNFNREINTSLKNNTIYVKEKLRGEIIIIKERVAKIKWRIHHNEKDIILGYNCIKAIGEFRGRLYTVWFTKEIPVPFGPWKLNGLPGLILGVKDNLNQVEFVVDKIERFEARKFKFDFPEKENKYPIISLREYVSERNKDLQSKMQKILSKMPKGVKISNVKSHEYKGLELKYGWEEN